MTTPTALSGRNNLAAAYESLDRWGDAGPVQRDALLSPPQTGPTRSILPGDLNGLGYSLPKQEKWSAAEPILAECVAIRSGAVQGDWSRFNALSELGGSLLGQGLYAKAEQVVVPAYEGMKARETRIPAPAQPRLFEAAVRVVRLYEGWGKPELATVWKKKLGLADLPADVFAPPVKKPVTGQPGCWSGNLCGRNAHST